MQIFNLDLSIKRIVPLLNVKQRDVGAKIQVVLTDDKKEYIIPDGIQFSVWFSGRSGEGNYTKIDGRDAFSVDGNKVTVELIYQMLNNPGEHAMCLVMNGADGTQLGLWNIPYFVEPIPGADSVGALQYYQAFLKAQENAEKAAQEAKDAAQKAKQQYYTTPRKKIDVSYDEINTEYIWSLYRTLDKQYPGHVQEIDYSIGDFEQHAFVISTGEYPTEGYYTKDEGYGADPHIKKPKYLLLSGIHGIERKAVFSAYRFIQDVLSGHNVPRDFKEGAIICVMPVGNPDGFDKFTYENEDGVNINRDFDEIEKGTAAKQTQAIANWLAQNKDAELFIDFHNSSSVNEIVAILGCSDNNVIDSAKRVALRGIDRVIPFWKTIITDTKVGTPVYDSNGKWQHNEEKDVIFAYSASLSMKYNLKELAIGYATIVLGIPSIAIETLVYCGDYYPELATEPDYQPQAIALGAEALGNVLLEFYNQALSFRPDAIIKTNVTPAYNGEVVITNTSETQKRFYNGEVK